MNTSMNFVWSQQVLGSATAADVPPEEAMRALSQAIGESTAKAIHDVQAQGAAYVDVQVAHGTYHIGGMPVLITTVTARGRVPVPPAAEVPRA
jgi:hypothetical protein